MIKRIIVLSLSVRLGGGGDEDSPLSVSKLDRTLKKKCKSFCKDKYGSDDGYMFSECYDGCLEDFYIEADRKDRKRSEYKSAASKSAQRRKYRATRTGN